MSAPGPWGWLRGKWPLNISPPRANIKGKHMIISTIIGIAICAAAWMFFRWLCLWMTDAL